MLMVAIGCTPGDAEVSIDLCLAGSQANALSAFVASADFFGVRMTVEGPGFVKVETLITEQPLPTTINTPPFSVGDDRVITLEYLTQDLIVRFRGRTSAFDVAEGKSATTTMVLSDMTTPLLLSTGDTQIRTPTTVGHTAALKTDDSGEVVLFGGGLPLANVPGSGQIATYQSFVQDAAKNCQAISLLTATLAQPRLFHATVVLGSGSFFVYGGADQATNGSVLSFPETFDRNWARQTDNSLPAEDARSFPLLISLPLNRALSIGGNDNANAAATQHRVFLFDANDPLLTDASYVSSRCQTITQGTACEIGNGTAGIPSGPTGHFLASGVGFVAGGGASFFLLDPDDLKEDQPFQTLSGITTPPTFSHASALLSPGDDGRDRILVVGGFDGTNTAQDTIRLIVTDGTAANTEEILFCGAKLGVARTAPSATALYDGSALICGGANGGTVYDSCELVVVDSDNTQLRVYSNDTNERCLPVMAQSKFFPTATLLPDNTILLVGSTSFTDAPNAQTHIERFNPPLALDMEILAGVQTECAPAEFEPPNPGPDCPP